MLYVGIDDTDGPGGMCTTFLVNKVLGALEYPPGELPRLIRLNPTVPWKTRGNGAVSIVLDAPHDAASKVLDVVADIVRKNAPLGEENTNPGVVVAPVPPDIDFYWRAVKGIVTVEDARDVIRNCCAESKGFKNCRGLIGATAAVSWHQDDVENVTYEVIAYRQEKMWGKPRSIEIDSIKEMDRKCKGTFNNLDETNRHVANVPNTPCPVLFGIRGVDNDELIMAKDMIRGEEMAGWTLFISNQGTDDHLVPRKISEIGTMESPIIEGHVSAAPRTIKGGHVFFTLEDETGSMQCAAYEPTKEFRDAVRLLAKGDRVVAMGSVREEPRAINLEKLMVLERGEEEQTPKCPACGRSMKSAGVGQGYRCRGCKTSAAAKERQPRIG
ncbi:MAG: tRNA(Ile)(2)-agmatinylcytidine synthase, partial [Candidatus Thermoplasmatota archaeon]|nr:tRNA(Ile)(2)-agmatinylcytidine synthase [Candidatus Thermoplasmatota archaeon]